MAACQLTWSPKQWKLHNPFHQLGEWGCKLWGWRQGALYGPGSWYSITRRKSERVPASNHLLKTTFYPACGRAPQHVCRHQLLGGSVGWPGAITQRSPPLLSQCLSAWRRTHTHPGNTLPWFALIRKNQQWHFSLSLLYLLSFNPDCFLSK